MTRAIFLRLSQSRALREFMEGSAFARRLNRRFVAGVTLAEAVAVCETLAHEGLWATLDHLGENVATLADAEAAQQAYLEALSEIAARRLPATVSLKLTALGLDVNESAAREHLRALACRAREIGSRVEVDMEDSRYTEATVRMVEQVGRETGVLRVAIQAYLHRTPDDIARLNRAGVMVRLCKGAYIEPPALAMPRKADVDAAYLRLVGVLLEQGVYPAFATHDPRMIEAVLGHRPAPERFEFQMLHGVRRDLQRDLVRRGYHVRVYVPYGAQWYRYFMRRLAERPANVWFLIRNLMR
jgi:proline dehydrogenase